MKQQLAKILGGLLLSFTCIAYAGLDEGVRAYQAGDYATAYVEWLPLAQQGDADAQYSLGQMYLNGQGVSQDYVQATSWYRKAAEQGDAIAQSNLGVMYEHGQGVPKDDVQAVAWYRKAAEQGDAIAQFNLGVMYRRGQGVPQNTAVAYALYNLSAATDSSSNNKAPVNRDAISQSMMPQQIKQGKSLTREIQNNGLPAIDAYLQSHR